MRKRILIVDDDPDIAELLHNRLKFVGYNIDFCTNAKSALDQIKKNAPDLIILDVVMPGMKGTTMCYILKNDQRYNSIPVIIISSQKVSDMKQDLDAAGADAFISKPFESETVLKKVYEFLGS